MGISFEQYKHDRKERETEITKQPKLAHEEPRKVLLIEKADIELPLTNAQTSYQQYIDNLKERIKQLAEKDKYNKADQIFAQVEHDTEAAVQAAAESAYQRRLTAKDNIR
jgi:intergrase/recombinase